MTRGALTPQLFWTVSLQAPSSFNPGRHKRTPAPTQPRAALSSGILCDAGNTPHSNMVVTGPHVALELLRCGQCDWGTGFLILFNFNECTFYTTILDSAALENQSDKLHLGSSCPCSGFTEKIITCPFILCSQISAPLTWVSVTLRNGCDANKVQILSLKWPINK